MPEMTTLEENIVQHEYPDSPNAEMFAQVEKIISDVRPGIQRDGGDIALASIAGDLIRVRLTGACTHCALAGQTLGGIRRRVMAETGLPMRVLPVPID